MTRKSKAYYLTKKSTVNVIYHTKISLAISVTFQRQSIHFATRPCNANALHCQVNSLCVAISILSCNPCTKSTSKSWEIEFFYLTLKNFKAWKIKMMLALECLDLNYALQVKGQTIYDCVSKEQARHNSNLLLLQEWWACEERMHRVLFFSCKER